MTSTVRIGTKHIGPNVSAKKNYQLQYVSARKRIGYKTYRPDKTYQLQNVSATKRNSYKPYRRKKRIGSYKLEQYFHVKKNTFRPDTFCPCTRTLCNIQYDYLLLRTNFQPVCFLECILIACNAFLLEFSSWGSHAINSDPQDSTAKGGGWRGTEKDWILEGGGDIPWKEVEL